ncbi:MAG: hypothetical protein HQK54_08730, partial [Oligoflexales bacterium]|nr:hypothetical protein [Oligoflexales bacterium]
EDTSYAEPWPAGETYSQNVTNFKQACQRTIGTSTPDLCARINVNIKGTSYRYAQRRHCYYKGPQDYPSFLGAGLRAWDKSGSLQNFSDWTPTDEAGEGEKIVSDLRTVWKDDLPHNDFGPGPAYALHQWYPHVLSNIKVGKVQTKEFRSKTTIVSKDCSGFADQVTCNGEKNCSWQKTGTTTVPSVSATGEPVMDSQGNPVTKTVDVMGCVRSQDIMTTFEVRLKSYEWQTSCNYREPTADDFFGTDFSVCFYLTYHNIEDRNNCQRLVSDYVCRNMNGCFTGDTMVLMADGSQKRIEEIKESEMVYNPSTRKPSRVSRIIVGEERRDLYRINFGTGEVTATYSHPFITSTGLKTAQNLRVGDQLADRDIGYLVIKSIDKVTPPRGTLVWNLLLDNTGGISSTSFMEHTFVANGLASGDYFIQESNGYMKDESRGFSRFLIEQIGKNKLKSR